MPTVQGDKNWAGELETVSLRIVERFSLRDLRGHAGRYLQGLISRIERKNGWQLAEELGEPTPTNLQHFIIRSSWNADEVIGRSPCSAKSFRCCEAPDLVPLASH